MTYIERLEALILKRGGSVDGIKTVSDAISALEELESKKPAVKSVVNRPAPVITD